MNNLTSKLQMFSIQLRKVHTPDKTIWWHGYDSKTDIFGVLEDLINISRSSDGSINQYIEIDKDKLRNNNE